VAGFRSNLSSFPARVVILLGGIQSLRRAPVGARRRYPSLTSTERRLVVWRPTHGGTRTPSIASVAVTSALSRHVPLVLRARGLFEARGYTSTFSAYVLATKSVFWFRIQCDDCSQFTVLVCSESAAMVFASRI
jgi:hypothetical protein